MSPLTWAPFHCQAPSSILFPFYFDRCQTERGRNLEKRSLFLPKWVTPTLSSIRILLKVSTWIKKSLKIFRNKQKEPQRWSSALISQCTQYNEYNMSLGSESYTFQKRAVCLLWWITVRGGDLFRKINSQKGVLFSEDQVSHLLFEATMSFLDVLDDRLRKGSSWYIALILCLNWCCTRFPYSPVIDI